MERGSAMTMEMPKRKLGTWIFNPAMYVAGVESLITGVSIILVASWLGCLSRTHFDGVLDVHTGMDAPPWFFVAEGFLSWLSVVLTFWIVGRVVSRTSFRLVDLAGTQAVARVPMLFTAVFGLLPGYGRFSQALMKTVECGVPPTVDAFLSLDAIWFLVVLLVMVVAACWMIALMYRSYVHVCNIRGGRAGWSFVGALVVAELLSKVVIVSLSSHVLIDDSWKPRKGELPPESTSANYQHEQHYTFDTEAGIEKINVDKGLKVGVEKGEFRIHGQTDGPEWKPDSVQVPVLDNGGTVDISGRFRIAERSGGGLIFIEVNTEKAGPIIYMHQWAWPSQNSYRIQRRWLRGASSLVSEHGNLRALGNEEKAFNTMRIHIREDHQHADLFVNDTYQDTIVFAQPMGNVVTAKMEFQTNRRGERYDIRFDDLRIRWNDSAEELKRKDALNKTGGLLLRYTFDDLITNATTIADSSGQEANGDACGHPQFAEGVRGNAMVLDGEDDYIKVPITWGLREVQNSNYTVMAWFKPVAVPPSDKYIYGVVIKPGCDYGIAYDAGRTFRFTHFDDVAGIWLGQGLSQPGQWHHVAVVGRLDENRFMVFTNGMLAASEVKQRFGRSLKNDRSWYIGVADPNVWRCPARGMVDDVRIYNRALSDVEIRAIVEETLISGQ
jgi:hypothetical protein